MTIQITGVEEVEKKLKSLSSVMQSKLLRKLGNKVASQAKQRITSQTDLEGRGFAARAININKPKRKKLLAGLKKLVRVVSVNNEQVVIGFTGLAQTIAGKQQSGFTENRTSAQNRAVSGALTKPATKKQALTLIALGYLIKKRKPTVNAIRATMTIGRAGLIIRQMRIKQGIPIKSSWKITTPARAFLGVNADDEKALVQIITDEINKTIN